MPLLPRARRTAGGVRGLPHHGCSRRHHRWLLASSWDNWRALFEEQGYTTLAPGWPDDPGTVEEAHDDIGAWVDRVNRKGLMIGLDICRAVVLAVLPSLALLGHVPIWWIYLVTFINSTLTIGFQSATTAAIPSMVAQDGLVKANGRIQASAPFATIIGPLLAALLLAVTSLQAVLWCDALTFVVSAISGEGADTPCMLEPP